MGEFGTCATGCSEQKLELVRAAAHDKVVAIGTGARVRAEAFRSIAEKLATVKPAPTEFEAAYRSIQREARNALRRHADPGSAGIDLEQPSEAAITWWCPACGGLDAPQDCLGICVWRRVEWVRRSLYERERKRAALECADERGLRELLRRIAYVTPRPEQWQRGWIAIQADVRQALTARKADCEPSTTPPAARAS